MKKILQALDGASTKKPAEGSNEMKTFLQIMEGKGPLNRLTQSEAITLNHYTPETRTEITSPVLNVSKDAKTSMVGKYFKQVEQEFVESAERSKERARQLAERVIERIVPGQEPAPGINRLTGKPNPAPNPEVGRPGPSSSGYSREYLEKAANPNRVGRFLISIEQAQELLKQLDTPVDEGFLGLSSKEKGAIMNLTNELSDIPNMWDHEKQTFTNLGKESLEKTLNYNPKYIKYALNLTSKDYEADLDEVKQRLDAKCWKGKHKEGTKIKGGVRVNNCVPNKKNTP